MIKTYESVLSSFTSFPKEGYHEEKTDRPISRRGYHHRRRLQWRQRLCWPIVHDEWGFSNQVAVSCLLRM